MLQPRGDLGVFVTVAVAVPLALVADACVQSLIAISPAFTAVASAPVPFYAVAVAAIDAIAAVACLLLLCCCLCCLSSLLLLYLLLV